MELALSGCVAGQERGLHLSAHSTAGVSLPAMPLLWDGLQMHPTVLLHHQSLRATTCLASSMEMGTLCKGRGQRWFLCIEFLWVGA